MKTSVLHSLRQLFYSMLHTLFHVLVVVDAYFSLAFVSPKAITDRPKTLWKTRAHVAGRSSSTIAWRDDDGERAGSVWVMEGDGVVECVVGPVFVGLSWVRIVRACVLSWVEIISMG